MVDNSKNSYSNIIRNYNPKDEKQANELKKILEVTHEKLVSIDFNHHSASAIVDASLTIIQSNSTLLIYSITLFISSRSFIKDSQSL